MEQLIYEELKTYKDECTVTELLYVYLDNIRCFKDNAFTFTSEYKITYNNPKYNKDESYNKKNNLLEIKEIDSNVPKNFFGENISNINLIVGKNGSGKSTLLSLFDDREKEKIINEMTEDSSYFILYKTTKENIFYIEGYNINFFLNDNKVDENNEIIDNKKYSFIYNIKKKKMCIVNKNKVKISLCLVNRRKNNEYSIFRMHNNDTDSDFNTLAKKKNESNKYVNGISYERLYTFLNEYDKYNNLIKREDFSLDISVFFDSYFINEYEAILNKLDITNEYRDIEYTKIKDYFREKDSLDISKQNPQLEKIFYDSLLIYIIVYLYNNLTTKSEEKIFEFDNKDKAIRLNTLRFNEEKLTIKFLFEKLYEILIDVYLEERRSDIDNYLYQNLEKKLFKFMGCFRDSSKRKSLYTLKNKTHFSEVYNYCINIHFEKNINKSIVKYLSIIDDLRYFFESLTGKEFNMFEIKFGNNISDGELQSLISYERIYQVLKDSKMDCSIVLLDEPEKGFHPEWVSEFISDLVDLTRVNVDKKYQFIISTHSPFMLSDVPKECIQKIKVDEDGKRVIKNASHSFASNYYELINDSFFLDSTLGKFASKKIAEISTYIINTDRAYSRIKNKLKEFNSNIHGYVDINDEEINNWLNSIYKYFNKDDLLKKWIVSPNCYRVSKDSFKDLLEIIKHLQISDIEKQTIKEQIDINLANLLIKKFNENYGYLKTLINVIDEPFIRNSFKAELDRVYDLILSSNESSNAIDNEIKRLKERIEKLEKIQEKQNDKAK